jgi:hypothetical protein
MTPITQPDTQPDTQPPDPPAKGKMLPGVAAITLYLSLFTLATVFFALTGKDVVPNLTKYGVLLLYTLLAVGLYGQLRMRRWGWSIVLAGCLLLSVSYFYAFSIGHQFPSLIQGLFTLLFFLYLVRPEVRDRMV